MNRLRKRSTSLLTLNPSGTAEDNQSVRRAMAKQAAMVSGALVTLARKSGNSDLAEKAHLTQTMLLSGRAIDAVEKAEHLVALADEHREQLLAYKITSERLSRLDDLTTEFSESIGRPRSIIKARSLVRKSLPDLFALADVELEHMDRLLPLLEEDYPEFVQGFRSHRKIDQVSASRALTELEKANAAAREAKQKLAKAKKAVKVADKQAETEAILAEVRAIQPSAAPGIVEGISQRSETPASGGEVPGLSS